MLSAIARSSIASAYNNKTASFWHSGLWPKADDLFFEECGALPRRRYGKDTTRFLARKMPKNPDCANGLWEYVGR
jgi:hypothetical protein